MPTLDLADLELLRSKPARVCGACGRAVNPNYCRSCDEFFEAGHLPIDGDCTANAAHDTHRTY